MKYSVDVIRSAQKQLEKFPADHQERILVAMEGLAEVPRPDGSSQRCLPVAARNELRPSRGRRLLWVQVFSPWLQVFPCGCKFSTCTSPTRWKPCHHGEREVPDPQGAIAHQGPHGAAVTGQLLEDHWPAALHERLTSQHAARDSPMPPFSTAVNNRPPGRTRHGNNAPE